MLSVRAMIILCGAAAVDACTVAAVPVTALPGPNKDLAAFNKDETACRREAALAAYPGGNGAPGPAASSNVNVNWRQFFTSFAKCETARGNLIQPVPWAVAYAVYLGYGPSYPPPYPPVYGYAYPPYGAVPGYP